MKFSNVIILFQIIDFAVSMFTYAEKKGHLLSKILVSTNYFLGIKPHSVQFFETLNFHKKIFICLITRALLGHVYGGLTLGSIFLWICIALMHSIYLNEWISFILKQHKTKFFKCYRLLITDFQMVYCTLSLLKINMRFQQYYN
jgi:hypothetical protein